MRLSVSIVAEHETGVLDRRRIRPDEIARQGAQVMEQDRGLFVSVGVERDAPLLHQHAAEVLRGSNVFRVKSPFIVGFLWFC